MWYDDYVKKKIVQNPYPFITNLCNQKKMFNNKITDHITNLISRETTLTNLSNTWF